MSVELITVDQNKGIIEGDVRDIQVLSSAFSFESPGFRFSSAYKEGYWDGKIKLIKNGTFSIGLADRIEQTAIEMGIEITNSIEKEINSKVPDNAGDHLAKHFDSIYTPKDFQNEAVVHGLKNNRVLFISPTASGKSFIIYLLCQYHVSKGRKVLVIVNRRGLSKQMKSDFIEYNKGRPMEIAEIKGKDECQDTESITISTWQSCVGFSEEWFSQFEVVCGDEAHNYQAKSLIEIMDKLIDTKYRYAFTGSLQDEPLKAYTVEGLFGPVYVTSSSEGLMKRGDLAKLIVRPIILEHPKTTRKKRSYPEEMEHLASSESRNKLICKMADHTEGNTIILFNLVDKHGKPLYEMLPKYTKKKVYFIHGAVDANTREEYRQEIENSNDVIVLASLGTTSEGTNIKNLHNLILASTNKSKVRTLQTIGRILRVSDGKERATAFDIVDDLSFSGWDNFALKHYSERMKYYMREGFEVIPSTMSLK